MDISFLGQFEAAVEDGRITLPASIRDAIPRDMNALFVFPGMFPCLFVVTEEGWRELTQPYRDVALADATKMLVQERIGPGRKVNIDRTGRMVIAQHLWEWAGIGISGKCAVRGCLQRIELWSPERLKEHEQQMLSVGALLGALREAKSAQQ